MNVRRREALGRNRRGPGTTGTMGAMMLLCAVILALTGFAFKYFTQPERVFGAKALDCSATKIQWERRRESTLISGCGRKVEAVCDEKCVDALEASRITHSHEF